MTLSITSSPAKSQLTYNATRYSSWHTDLSTPIIHDMFHLIEEQTQSQSKMHPSPPNGDAIPQVEISYLVVFNALERTHAMDEHLGIKLILLHCVL